MNKNYEYILNFLQEVNISPSTSYTQSLINLKNYLKIKNNPQNFSVLFGQFGFASKDYTLLSQKEIEEVRKYLKKIKGIKLNVRIFPTIKLSGKDFFAFVEPDMVLWEITGANTEFIVQNLAAEIEKKYNIPLKIVHNNQ